MHQGEGPGAQPPAVARSDKVNSAILVTYVCTPEINFSNKKHQEKQDNKNDNCW